VCAGSSASSVAFEALQSRSKLVNPVALNTSQTRGESVQAQETTCAVHVFSLSLKLLLLLLRKIRQLKQLPVSQREKMPRNLKQEQEPKLRGKMSWRNKKQGNAKQQWPLPQLSVLSKC
jgi:hypothetical protein